MYFLFKFIPINLKRKCISLVRITQTYVDVSTLLRSNLTYYSSVLHSHYGHVQFLAYCPLKLFCRFLGTCVTKELLSEYL